MDYFYDGQIRRYVTQFMRVFIGFKYKAGDGTETSVPVMYGDMSRQVASIIKENSENKLPNVPRIACYITGMDMDTQRLSDASFVSKVNIRERRYTDTDNDGMVEYQNIQGGNYTVERLMPTPYKLSMKCDIWTSNTDQKLQLFEQIMVLFNPSLELQTTDNYIDWTSLSVLDVKNIQFSSRTIPAGAESEIDICSIEFEMPIWISPPSKVKKLGVVKNIITNVFMESGDLINLEDLVYNRRKGTFDTTTNRYRILLFKSNNGQPYDYDMTLVNPDAAVLALGLEQRDYKNGEPVLWDQILDVQGGYTVDSQAYFRQPSGNVMFGTFSVNPLDQTTLIVTFDQDTVPQNTIIPSTINGVSARGTVDAIIDPYKYNPTEVYKGLENIPLGTRFLMLDDVNPSENRGGFNRLYPGDDSTRDPYRGPQGWKDLNDQDPYIKANSIIEWNGQTWVSLVDDWQSSVFPYEYDTVVYKKDTIVKFEGTVYKALADVVTQNNVISPSDNPELWSAITLYIQNLKTGIKYRWDLTQWVKAFEGEYAPGYWGFRLDP